MLRVENDELYIRNQLKILNTNCPFKLNTVNKYVGFAEVLVFKIELVKRLIPFNYKNLYSPSLTHDIIITYGNYLCEKESENKITILTTTLSDLYIKWVTIINPDYNKNFISRTNIPYFCYQNKNDETVNLMAIFLTETNPDSIVLMHKYGKLDLSNIKNKDNLPMTDNETLIQYNNMNTNFYNKMKETLNEFIINDLCLLINEYLIDFTFNELIN
jgi:hypothetical protein